LAPESAIKQVDSAESPSTLLNSTKSVSESEQNLSTVQNRKLFDSSIDPSDRIGVPGGNVHNVQNQISIQSTKHIDQTLRIGIRGEIVAVGGFGCDIFSKKWKIKSIERERRYTAVASVTKSKKKDALTPIISANENVADTAVQEESSDQISINQNSVSFPVESLSNAPASPSGSGVRHRERSSCC
jgi:hypothetical protein